MNLYFVSYSVESPNGIPESVVADRWVQGSTHAGETIDFFVDRPAGSSSQVASIVVLSVPASWISQVQEVGVVSVLPARP